MYALSFFQDNNRTQMQDYDRHKELENESIARLLWRYSLPAIVGTLVNSLYNVVDRIYIGQGAGPMAIAGLALTFPIMNILGACGMLIGQGAATQVSLFLGRHDNRTANNILGNAVVMDLMMFAVVSTVMYIFLDEILILLGGTEEIIPYAHEYMQVILPFHVITSMSFSTNNIMRASGYPRKAMWTLVIGAVLNVVLDPIFIFGFDMGIRGAAIATVISMTVSCAWVMIHFADSRHTVHLSLKDMRLRWSTMLKILAIGLSPFFLQVGISLVNIESTEHNICITVFRHSIKTLVSFDRSVIIGINEGDVFTCGDIEARVACVAEAAVLFVHDFYSRVFLCVFVTQLRAIVWRAIVNHNYLNVIQSLIKQRLHATVEILLYVVNWNNYTNFRHG